MTLILQHDDNHLREFYLYIHKVINMLEWLCHITVLLICNLSLDEYVDILSKFGSYPFSCGNNFNFLCVHKYDCNAGK
jgi:hypothetical protein